MSNIARSWNKGTLYGKDVEGCQCRMVGRLRMAGTGWSYNKGSLYGKNIEGCECRMVGYCKGIWEEGPNGVGGG